uniref:Uncharacterized protein n=1 Tax=Parastrongyloides trichosuri TaxID=131310 RepID=A0A0N4Z3C5_PARTI
MKLQQINITNNNTPKIWMNICLELMSKTFNDNKQIKFIRRWIKKSVDFKKRIKSNHLKLEPLCCLQSCLIREGCITVAVMEAIFVVISFICLFVDYHNNELIYELLQNSSIYKFNKRCRCA